MAAERPPTETLVEFRIYFVNTAENIEKSREFIGNFPAGPKLKISYHMPDFEPYICVSYSRHNRNLLPKNIDKMKGWVQATRKQLAKNKVSIKAHHAKKSEYQLRCQDSKDAAIFYIHNLEQESTEFAILKSITLLSQKSLSHAEAQNGLGLFPKANGELTSLYKIFRSVPPSCQTMTEQYLTEHVKQRIAIIEKFEKAILNYQKKYDTGLKSESAREPCDEQIAEELNAHKRVALLECLTKQKQMLTIISTNPSVAEKVVKDKKYSDLTTLLLKNSLDEDKTVILCQRLTDMVNECASPSFAGCSPSLSGRP